MLSELPRARAVRLSYGLSWGVSIRKPCRKGKLINQYSQVSCY